ncbi:hypothetical protein [Vibrio cincinnatiensis]|uniref:hypothetical protein n=1 Tax=Vibrio cincinnatiensis TaxID=675 RepID=UPI001EE04FC6|nr:hypothetical protein [Vibrio cincinnatiensis]MCG3723693.1 hypothetical protein [Vibrio cincinnatiensis]
MINEVSTRLLVLSMDMEAYKQQVAAVNVANASNKGYTVHKVNFNQVLEQLESSSDRHQLARRIELYKTDNIGQFAEIEPQIGGAPVMLDEEILASSQAAGKYQALAELLDRRFGLIRMGIKGQ